MSDQCGFCGRFLKTNRKWMLFCSDRCQRLYVNDKSRIELLAEKKLGKSVDFLKVERKK